MPDSVKSSRPSRGFDGSSFKHTPLEHVRTLLVSFVQGLFQGAPTGCFKWDPDEEKTEIVIRDENPLNIETVGKRPCINFTMGPVRFYNVGMDDLMSYSFDISKKTKGVLVPGTMTINVCSRVDIECQNLSWVVAEHVWMLREKLLREGFFEIGRGIDIGSPSPPGSIIANDMGSEWYCCPVTIPYQFARMSSFTPLGKEIVRSIESHLRTRDPRHVESLGPVGGYRVEAEPPPPYSGASDAHGGTPDPGGTKSNPLPKQPHPLNPAKTVTVRSVHPYRAGLRPPSMRGVALPIVGSRMEESDR